MERTIDRTSYRRSARTEVKKEKIIEEKSFGYINIFLNQMIVSLLIIIAILVAKYFDINILDKWINNNMSDGYELSEVIVMIKKLFDFKEDNFYFASVSGDKNISGEKLMEVSGDVSILSGETHLKTAVEGVNQMLDDAKFVKENYEIDLPLSGIVTSDFGCRISDNEIVSSYHTGLDIAANNGTYIYAAHTGIVTMAKTFSSYGKCIMIEDGDLVTLYAHCSSLNVSEGQKINKGDFIGKVGMTGNATGPHLHFEIRYQERYIDPKDVIGEI